MITIFSIPKPFVGHIGVIQRNAIRSWLQQSCKPEVVLFCTDEGVAEVSAELGVQHCPSIESNRFGTPLVSSAFKIAQERARTPLMMYTNADMIYPTDLAIASSQLKTNEFLACGRRWDVDITEEIDFREPDWHISVLDKLKANGKLHAPAGSDYFIFPRGLVQMPEFAVGRPGWDNWLIYNMRARGIAVVDATNAITAVHQNHDYSHSRFGGSSKVLGPEYEQNVKSAHGHLNMMTLRDANWILDDGGMRKPGLRRRILSSLSLFYPWRLLLLFKRRIQFNIDLASRKMNEGRA